MSGEVPGQTVEASVGLAGQTSGTYDVVVAGDATEDAGTTDDVAGEGGGNLTSAGAGQRIRWVIDRGITSIQQTATIHTCVGNRSCDSRHEEAVFARYRA